MSFALGRGLGLGCGLVLDLALGPSLALPAVGLEFDLALATKDLGLGLFFALDFAYFLVGLLPIRFIEDPYVLNLTVSGKIFSFPALIVELVGGGILSKCLSNVHAEIERSWNAICNSLLVPNTLQPLSNALLP